MPMSNPAAGPLSDLTVLDLCDEKGQLMGKLLGDMGARVIKVEPPGGDPARRVGPFRDDRPDPDQSLYFWTYHTSKESITLDIGCDSGRRILQRLVEGADVVLESFDPGYLESLGLGYPQLSVINPALIMTSLTGFGQTGPYRDYKTSDLVAMAMGGIMNSCGYDDVPGSPPIRPTDGHGYHTGAHYGVIGTLMAILHRDMTGEGQYVDASIHEACSCTTEASVPQYLMAKTLLLRRTGRPHSAQPTPKSICPTKDGGLVMVFAFSTSLNAWRTLVSWMEERGMAEDLADDKYLEMVVVRSRSGPEMDRVYEVIRKFVRAHTADEIYHGAQQRKFPWGIVRSPEETLDDPHLWERGFFEEVEHPELGRKYTYPGRPYILSKTPWKTRRAPLLGEHNESIYVDELGLTEDEIAGMRRDGVI